jgi:hypothetical protein
MTRAYGVPVVEGDFGTTEGRRPRVVRGRPNWWVILAVSLALMALLVATAGNPPRANRHRHADADAGAAASDAHHAATQHSATGAGGTNATRLSGSATTTTTSPASAGATGSSTSLLSSRQPSGTEAPTTVPASVTTTTAPAATTTTTAPAATAAPDDATQTEGILNPPGQRSNGFHFTGTGATTVSVDWSGSTYLTLEVSCPSASQSVGGTSVMEATLPDASGSCLATVSEPASEDTALTYTITIGPAGG